MWFGPPAYRIPVGKHYAIPGPPRSVSFTSEDGGNYPGRTDDRSVSYFEELRLIENAQQMTKNYANEFRKIILDAADETRVDLDLISQNVSVPGNNVDMPENRAVSAYNIYSTYWSNCTPNFGVSPYGVLNAS